MEQIWTLQPSEEKLGFMARIQGEDKIKNGHMTDLGLTHPGE